MPYTALPRDMGILIPNTGPLKVPLPRLGLAVDGNRSCILGTNLKGVKPVQIYWLQIPTLATSSKEAGEDAPHLPMLREKGISTIEEAVCPCALGCP